MKIADHKFPSGVDYPLVMLSLEVQTLAKNSDIIPDIWEEDGLGTHRGFFVKAYGGPIILLSQSDHGIKHLGHKGPVVYVDVQDAIDHGYDYLLNSTLLTFNLSKGHICREIDSKIEWKNQAKSELETVERYRLKKNLNARSQ